MKTNLAADYKCDICHLDIRRYSHYFDASIPTFGGSWGWVCSKCAGTHGVRLGSGCGQKYDSQTNEKVQ